jgi:putative nucleotidyltransferase with HDIG domain
LRHIVQQAQHRVDIGVHRHHCLHSQFVAELSSQIARESGYVSPDEAYSAGLLHDIGLLWLIEYADDYLQMLVDIPDERTLTASELERFNEDHAEISSILASRCGLPAGISDAIALHQAEAASLVTAHPWFALLPPPKNLPTTGRPRRRSASRTPAASPGWMDRFSSACWPTPPARFRIELAPSVFRSRPRCSRAWGPAGNAATSPGSIDSGIARAALGAFARSSFGRGSSAWTDFSLASRLLLGLDAPVLFIKPLRAVI